MALGMAAMLAPPGGFGAGIGPADRLRHLAVALGLDRLGSKRGDHRLHHAAMSGIMALMVAPAGTDAARAAMPGTAASGMVMPRAGGGPPLVLLAAFGYACVFALVFAWRLPRLADACGRPGGADPLGHACEVTMLVSAAVMLLPMV